MYFHTFLVSPCIAFILSVTLVAAHLDSAQPFYCGVALSTGHDAEGYRKPKTNISIKQIRAHNANFIQISSYLAQIELDSTNTYQVTDDKSLIYIFRKVKQSGLKVFFKPVVETETLKGKYTWRGRIPGRKDWFEKVYFPYITRMARIAQQEGVDVFSIGSEYVATVKKTFWWMEVIKRVRAIYKGPITYIANHDSYEDVQFFHKLDFISISAYFKLLPGRTGYSPTLPQTIKMFQKRADKVSRWMKRKNLNDKKVLIAEFGMQSKGRGINYRVPWDWKAEVPTSLWAQAKMYEAFLGVFLSQEWSMGVMIWHWELENWLGKDLPSIQWFTPQHKPAAEIMKKYFEKYCRIVPKSKGLVKT